jgi:hypothetical protein
MTDDLTLPPLMGFPQEELLNPPHNCDFYTCVIEPFRVFVWGAIGTWLVQVGVNHPAMDIVKQFRDTMTDHHRILREPIALMCVIRELTSESNE